jgi:phosphoribosylformylglycinamidine cyclo-ligase
LPSKSSQPSYSADAYRAAGVDRDTAESLKEGLGAIVAKTANARVLGGIGGFGGMFRLTGYEKPVLVSSTDGVGTKLLLGRWTGRYEALGKDLVNACVNDVVVTGADPLFFLDYLAAGVINGDVVEALVRGMAEACADADCALVGGETAEMPGVYEEGDFDMAGFVVGAVEQDAILDPANVKLGDALVGIPSSGIHTNGFSLVRSVFGLDSDQSILDDHTAELGRTLGEELSEPHRSYVADVAAIRSRVKALAHITGGGLVDNVPRALPDGIGASVDPGSWDTPAIFQLIQAAGDISTGEMHRVFNMGIGMVAVCEPSEVDSVIASAPGSRVIGETVKAPLGEEATARFFLGTGTNS